MASISSRASPLSASTSDGGSPLKKEKSKKRSSIHFLSSSKSADNPKSQSKKDKKEKSVDKKKDKTKSTSKAKSSSILSSLRATETDKISNESILVSENSSIGSKDLPEDCLNQVVDLILLPDSNFEPIVTSATVTTTDTADIVSIKNLEARGPGKGPFREIYAGIDSSYDEFYEQRGLKTEFVEGVVRRQEEILNRLLSLERNLEEFEKGMAIKILEVAKTVDKLESQVSDMEARIVEEKVSKSLVREKERSSRERDFAQLGSLISGIENRLLRSDETLLEFVNATNVSVLKFSTILPHFVKLVQLEEVHTRALILLLGEKGYETLKEEEGEGKGTQKPYNKESFGNKKW